ncbi:P-loop ATPase, Sll1717 family [Planktotalea sp.]|uniref:P-loop ATPase, Sll1717 family n=1 Tax=Planktotalea sp. TaxID=2029877 RepID=UPI003D6B2D76
MINSTNPLEEISHWRVEAKLEDVPKYFFRGSDFESILRGRYAIVVGRKGTGKTAIAEYISQSKSHDFSSEKLSFKNFPFNELYKLEDHRFTNPNQYITIWKYVILSFVCKMMATNPRIDPLVGKQLSKAFGSTAEQNLAAIIKRWTVSQINLQVLGTGGGVEFKDTQGDSEWVDRVEMLESIVAKYAKGHSYILAFDELDEDFKDVVKRYNNDQYQQLITSLIKATAEIKSFSMKNGLNVAPIVFLRDDIYGLIKDNDKNKLVDVKLDLVWDKDSIQEMLAYRLSRSIGSKSSEPKFDHVWLKIFAHAKTRYGNKQQRSMNTFDFIARSTHMRPRDFIRYLQVASEHELKNKNTKIQGETLRRVDASFSTYLRDELKDEIESTIPEIESVFDVISHINKQYINVKIFRETFDEMKPTTGSKLDADTCLRLLFHFSVIGNTGRGNSPLEFFKYKYPNRKLNFGLPIIVHRGLFKALEIV